MTYWDDRQADDGLPCSTGYVHIRETNIELFGKEVIDKTEEVYGLDEEGELKGSYRPSGQPGVSGSRRTWG